MRIKERFSQIGASPESFVVISREMPSGLSGKLLWDLWDACSKFATELIPENGGLLLYHNELVVMIIDSRVDSEDEGREMYVLQKRKGKLAKEDVCTLSLTSDIQVKWDKGLSVRRVQKLLEQIDAVEKTEGSFEDGIRIATKITCPVARTFKRPGLFVPIPVSVSNEEMLEFWDRPELLSIFECNGGARILCLESDRNLAEDVINEKHRFGVLQDMGYRPN